MREAMAGFLVGYALSFATAPLLALAVVRMRLRWPVLARALEDRAPEGGLGSPNLVFTAIVLAWTMAVFSPPLLLLRAARRQVLAMAVVFVGAFGWLMPHLAQWSRFG